MPSESRTKGRAAKHKPVVPESTAKLKQSKLQAPSSAREARAVKRAERKAQAEPPSGGGVVRSKVQSSSRTAAAEAQPPARRKPPARSKQASVAAARTRKATKEKQKFRASQSADIQTQQVFKIGGQSARAKGTGAQPNDSLLSQDTQEISDHIISVQSWVGGLPAKTAPEDFEEIESVESDYIPSIINIWKQRYGGVPPENSMAKTDTDRAQSQKKEGSGNLNSAHPLFHVALLERNVNNEGTEDLNREAIIQRVIADRAVKPSDEEEMKWKIDLNKCRRSNESAFQHTIMMESVVITLRVRWTG